MCCIPPRAACHSEMATFEPVRGRMVPVQPCMQDIKASTQAERRPKQRDKPERQLKVIETQQKALSQSDRAPCSRKTTYHSGEVLGANKAIWILLLETKCCLAGKPHASSCGKTEQGPANRPQQLGPYGQDNAHRAAPPSTTPGSHNHVQI